MPQRFDCLAKRRDFITSCVNGRLEEGTTITSTDAMTDAMREGGEVRLYLPGVLIHWKKPGQNVLHHSSKALPKTLRFCSAIIPNTSEQALRTESFPHQGSLQKTQDLSLHPALRQSTTMSTFDLPLSISPLPLTPSLSAGNTVSDVASPPLTPLPKNPTLQEIAQLIETNHDQAFENTSTSVAASQMRNALNNLADTVEDPEEKKVRIIYTHCLGLWLMI